MLILVRHFNYVGQVYFVECDERKKLIKYSADKSKAHKFMNEDEIHEFAKTHEIENYTIESDVIN